ncbi:hypothetical protein LSAT2_010581 [Lamellibrachia satsuma]|nr:hypothetical protein LSAT2_010581 [Lamellibrachia satsuma]
MGRVSRTMVYDKLHKWSVTGLIGFTALSSVYLTYRFAVWWMYRRPQLVEKNRQFMEENLAKEQVEREAELMRQQRDAETYSSQ